MKNFNKEFLKFIDESPTAFQATENIKKLLKSNDFTQLHEKERWELEASKKYFVTRNKSSIIAFTLKSENYATNGFNIVGAHTDSPCLKLKPQPTNHKHGSLFIAVEPYGGGIWETWFDRELSIAGRVFYTRSNNELSDTLIDFKKPVATIPNLAIHLSPREVAKIDKQKELPPLMLLGEDSFEELLLKELKKIDKDSAEIISHELFFYPIQPSATCGYTQDFIAAPRLDNLLSCYTATKAIIESDSNSMIVLNDHEECGSASTSGAGGSFLEDVLQRITQTNENFQISNANSLLISADNAHAIHPNYPEKHEPGHFPQLNQGPVIKLNANQRYASNAASCAKITHIAKSNNIPLQNFVAHSNLGCGSTIGPITSTRLGIETIDIGAPTLAMHSARELTGSKDPGMLYQLLNCFFTN